MKAMVLAAGLGTRLRPLTDTIPKPAIPFFGRPILARTLDVVATLGATAAVVNTHHLAAQVAVLALEAPIPVELSAEPEILGTSGALWRARPWLEDAGEIVLVNGDVVFDLPLAELVAAHRAAGAAVTLGLLPNPDPARYSPIVAPEPWPRHPTLRRVTAIAPPGRGVDGDLYSGIAVIDPSVLARLPAGRSEMVPTLLRPLAAEGRLAGLRLDGTWLELGTPGDLLDAHLDLLARALAGEPAAASLVGRALRLERETASATHPTARLRGAVREVVADREAEVAPGARVSRSLLLPGARVASEEVVEDAIVYAGGIIRTRPRG